MPLNKVVITYWVHPEVTSFLQKFSSLVLSPQEPSKVYSREEVLKHSADASALITCMADTIDEEFLAGCPDLRIIAATLKGYDNYDVAACSRHSVWLTSVTESIIAPTAELAVTLTLALLRRVREGDQLVRGGQFNGWRPQLYGGTLTGATVGLIGMGQLGISIAELLDPFGCRKAMYTDENEDKHERLTALRNSWDRVDLNTLMRISNVVIVALPLTARTRHLIDASALSQISPGNRCHIINVGRGSVVDEQAVLNALNDGLLTGFAADVFEFEDWALPTRPAEVLPALRQHPRGLFTPHLGSAVDAIRKEMSLDAARQVQQVLKDGERPTGAVNDVKA